MHFSKFSRCFGSFLVQFYLLLISLLLIMDQKLEEAEAWIKQVDKKDFQVMINTLHAKMYDWLDYRQSKGEKITNLVTSMLKKVQDYITLSVIAISKENTVLTTRIAEMQNYSKSLDEIASKVSHISTGSVTDPDHTEDVATRPHRDEYTMMISAVDQAKDMEVLKTEITSKCKNNKDLPVPGDVVITKNKQVILKMKSRRETETIRDVLQKSDTLKKKIKINIPRRRRERVLILSVDQETKEETIRDTVNQLLLESIADEGIVRGLSKKLSVHTLDPHAGEILEDLYKETTPGFHIIKGIKTRNDKVNWLIDVDKKCKDFLLCKKRICIDFERYRVVEFVSIARCHNCQAFGYYAGSCKSDAHCVKCSESHQLNDCKSEELQCYNFYFVNSDGDCDHRDDSFDCPTYKAYRLKLLLNRR